MKSIEVVAAIIKNGDKIFATQRGYGPYKDMWEFPGGKMEKGESAEDALKREIMEELDTEIAIEKFICTAKHDYPEFHLTMHCFLSSIVKGDLVLKEHEDAKWLDKSHLREVNWLPADLGIISLLEEILI